MARMLSLPDELLDIILSMATDIPMNERNYLHRQRAASRAIINLLLVCRRFHQVGIPFLYRVVFLGPGLSLRNTPNSSGCLWIRLMQQDWAFFCHHITLEVPYCSSWASRVFSDMPCNLRSLWIRTRHPVERIANHLVTAANRLERLETLFVNTNEPLNMDWDPIVSQLDRKLVSLCVTNNGWGGDDEEQGQQQDLVSRVFFDYSRGSRSLLGDVVQCAMQIEPATNHDFGLELWQADAERGQNWRIDDIQTVLERWPGQIHRLYFDWKPLRVHASQADRPWGRFKLSRLHNLRAVLVHPLFLDASELPASLRVVDQEENLLDGFLTAPSVQESIIKFIQIRHLVTGMRCSCTQGAEEYPWDRIERLQNTAKGHGRVQVTYPELDSDSDTEPNMNRAEYEDWINSGNGLVA
ncbi:hypothetical protein QBC44DRAFT_402145 [Cladorrhinum sp. PSN332]|nr:hypothetical protein QBC44DRAFT_402145 [Cladorrhinum sp. PSN332]